MKKQKYIFTTNRLGFRNWYSKDLNAWANINADAEVMKFFPSTLTLAESEAFIERHQKHFEIYGFNYFACIELSSNTLIGCIGLAHQDYESPFTPAVDIGWRLKKEVWGKGYATEGAKACLQYGFIEKKIDTIISVCTIQNEASEKVMRKIGLQKKGTFLHPKVTSNHPLQKHLCYSMTNEDFKKSFFH